MRGGASFTADVVRHRAGIVAASSPSLAYAETRAFYAHRGFVPLEIFPTLWDARNPALQCIKVLAAEVRRD